MPDPTPLPTWADGAVPTVDQLRAWLRLFDPATHDARVAADMILGMLADEQRAHRATRMRYDASQEALGEVLTENRRNRLAWKSARRRARWHAWFSPTGYRVDRGPVD